MINYLEEEVERLFQQNGQLRAELLNETGKRQVVYNIMRKSKNKQEKKCKKDKRKNGVKQEAQKTVCED